MAFRERYQTIYSQNCNHKFSKTFLGLLEIVFQIIFPIFQPTQRASNKIAITVCCVTQAFFQPRCTSRCQQSVITFCPSKAVHNCVYNQNCVITSLFYLESETSHIPTSAAHLESTASTAASIADSIPAAKGKVAIYNGLDFTRCHLLLKLLICIK